ncbi:MAG TPA: outer membrane protein assembly factor BamB [Rhodocyclaceae bacterium]|jgi:outer membrane protein assembly factor BamB|nr:outer membrane protein assembly factor BamB [Rhodocyclaceae bacterium]
MDRRIHRLSQGIALLALTAALAACSSLNPFASKPDPKTMPAPLKDFRATVAIKTQWRVSLGAGDEFTFTPAVVGDSVYAASRSGALARYDNGQEIWRINVGSSISGGVGADANVVAVGTSKGDVLAFDSSNGKPMWTAKASSEVLAAPAVGAGLVIVRSGDSRVFAFAQADGKQRWVYQRAVPALTVRTNAGVVLVTGGILAGFPGGKLVAISSTDGVTLWEVSIAQPKGATELERIADITSPPVLDLRNVCAVAFQGRAACIDLSNGNNLWSRDVSSSAGLAVDSKAVYVSDDKGAVLALDRYTGSSLWKQSALANRGLSRPVVVGNYVVVGDAQGYVHVLSRDDGSFVGRMSTDGSAIAADPQPTAKGFVVQTKNGGVYSLTLDQQ